MTGSPESNSLLRPAIAVAAEAKTKLLSALVATLLHALASAATVVALIPVVYSVAPDSRSVAADSPLAPLTQPWPLEGALLLFVAALAIQAAFGRLQAHLAGDLATTVANRLRMRLFTGAMASDWAHFVSLRSADVLQTLTDGTIRSGYFARLLLTAAASALVVLAYVAVAFVVSPPITAAVLGAAAVTILILAPVRRLAGSAGERYTAASKAVYRSIADSLSAMRVVRTFGREEARAADLAAASAEARKATLEVINAEGRLKMWFDIAAASMLGVTLYVALRVFELPAATVLVLLVLASRLVPQISALQGHLQALHHTAPAVADVRGLTRALTPVDRSSSAERTVDFRRELALEQVSFTYDGRRVLADVSLTIPVRKTVALVGPSGAGKSTLVDIVLGLHAPEVGQVLLDGEPISTRNVQAWRRLVGYVPQDPVLLHDTIRANLLWAAPDASQIEITEVLRAAAADTFIHRLPEGLDTVVGDRGVRLSGGERQRIALAAALLRRPRILVLDEPASGLDAEHEREVQRSLSILGREAAILLVTHRLSAVRRADTIYVLDQGRVVEQGRWSELMSRPDGRFRALYDAQELDAAASPASEDARVTAYVE